MIELKLSTVPPASQGTLVFTNCWGIAQKSKNQAAAIDFVKFLTSTDQQMAFANAFGVMPSVQSAKSQFTAAFPDQQAFVAGGFFRKKLQRHGLAERQIVGAVDFAHATFS